MLKTRVDGEVVFDPHEWLAIHALVELRSVIDICPRYTSKKDLWDTVGFNVSRINRKFSFNAARCKNPESPSRLSEKRDILLSRIGLEDAGLLVQIVDRDIESSS